MILIVLCVGGCGSQWADVGAGAAAGGLLGHTMTGMEQGLEKREAYLVELYNKGVEAGAKKEYLDQIAQQLYDTRLGKQGVETAKNLMGVNWSDPKQTGGAIGLVSTLVYAFLKRKDLAAMTSKYKAHRQGAEKFMREHNSEAQQLYTNIGEARKANKVA